MSRCLDMIKGEKRTRIIIPKERAGSNKLTQDSIWLACTLNRGEMTPVLFRRPFNWMTIFPER